MDTSDDQTQEWKDAIYRDIKEAEKTNGFPLFILYSKASNAFPDGFYEKYPNIKKLNRAAFNNWLKQYNLVAELVSDHSQDEYEIPDVKISKLT